MHLHRLKVLVAFPLLIIVLFISTVGAFAADFTVEDISEKVTDAYLSAGETLIQKVKITEGEVNFTEIEIENISSAPEITKEDLDAIEIMHGDTLLLRVETDDLVGDTYEMPYDLDETIDLESGDVITIKYEIADTLYYRGVPPLDLRKFRPEVTIDAAVAKYREGESNKEIKFYPPFEQAAVLEPPNGGEFHGLKLWAARIRLTDDDENDYPVSVNPILLINESLANSLPEDVIEKIEIKNKNDKTLGTATNIDGFNLETGGEGVRVSTLQNNTASDDGDLVFNVYIYFSEDSIIVPAGWPKTQSWSLKLSTATFSHEQVSSSKSGEGVRLLPSTPQTQWDIQQNHRPHVNFTYDPSDNLNYNTEITFTPKNTYDEDGDTLVDFRWQFSDGATKSGYSVTHTFAEGGSVWAKLIVEDEYGVTGEKTKSFNVKEPGAPRAEFSYDPASPKVDEEITFTDESTVIGDADIVERTWDFGDEESVTYKDVNQTTATHTYNSVKVYQVTLTVKDSRGKSDSVTHEVVVQPIGVTAAFSVSPSSPVTNEPVTFADQSSTVAGEEIVKWEWDFGDGTTETIDSGNSGTTTHTYSSSGVYTVTLKATDSREKSGTVSHDVPVSARGVTADFSYDPSSPRINQEISFTDQSTIPEDSSIEKWIWEFGDGNLRTIIADGAQNGNTSHTYPETGTYQVTLTIITSNDLAASAIKEVTVGANPPEADFSYSPSLPQVDEVVQFSDNSTKGDGNIVSWEWDFGDGTTSTEQNPTHAYSEVNNYQVTLTVTDEYDNTDSVSKTVTVAEKGEDIPTYPYPNPAGSPVTIVYYLPANTTEAHLWIIDFSGELAVHRADLDTNTGENQLTVDLSDHPNGLYFYWIKGVADGKRISSKVRKLLVQHGG